MYLITGKVIEHIEEKNGNKYLIFGSSDEFKEVLKKYKELCNGINSIQDGVAKRTPTSFSPVTSTNVGISP